MNPPDERAMVRTLVVDDHAVFGESVARALSAEPDLDVSYCGTIADALRTLQQQPIDVVLLDSDLGAESASQFLPLPDKVLSGRVLIVMAWVAIQSHGGFCARVSPEFSSKRARSACLPKVSPWANQGTSP